MVKYQLTECMDIVCGNLGFSPSDAQLDFAKDAPINHIIKAPCGSGKSVMAIATALYLTLNKKVEQVYLSTGTNSLANQYAYDLTNAGIPHLVIKGKDNYPCAALYDLPGELLERKEYLHHMQTELNLTKEEALQRWSKVSAMRLPSLADIGFYEIVKDSIDLSLTNDKIIGKAWEKLKKTKLTKENITRALTRLLEIMRSKTGFIEKIADNVGKEPYYAVIAAKKDHNIIVTNHYYSLCFMGSANVAFIFDECHKLVAAKRDFMHTSLRYDALVNTSPKIVENTLRGNLEPHAKFEKLTKKEDFNTLEVGIQKALKNLATGHEYECKKEKAVWEKVYMSRAEEELFDSLPEFWLMLSATPPKTNKVPTKAYGKDPMLNLQLANPYPLDCLTGDYHKDKLLISKRTHLTNMWSSYVADCRVRGMGIVLETRYSGWEIYDKLCKKHADVKLIKKRADVNDELLQIRIALAENLVPILITVSIEGLNINLDGISKAGLIPAMKLPCGYNESAEIYGKCGYKMHPLYHSDKEIVLEQQLGRINRKLEDHGSIWWAQSDYRLLYKVAPHLRPW